MSQWDIAAELAQELEERAGAHYAAGELEACISTWEELCGLLADDGDRAGAARAAAMISMYLMMDTGLMAPVRGWLTRAERFAEGLGEVPAHALIAMVRAYERLMTGDMAGAGQQARLAIELGDRLGVEPAVVIGRVASARVRIFEGAVEEGLALLDEVGTFLMSGGADPLTTGMMYCELICAAQGMALHDRASEWTMVMERWRQGAAFGGINGRCRVHRAEVLRMTGPCDAAEREALAACEELRPWMRREFGWPLVELGNVRWRRGDFEGAAEAYLAAYAHAWSPEPGLALVRLAQGDVVAAMALIGDAVAHPFDIPSKERPPSVDLRLAPLLEAHAEIAVAAGELEIACKAAASLHAIAERYPSRSLAAGAALARARVALAAGDAATALDLATDAAMSWADVGAPFETARARLVVADAHAALGHEVQAELERNAAREALVAFGALGWVERIDVGPRPARRRAEPPGTAVFRQVGELRNASFAGQHVVVRDLKGYRYLERLLAAPGQEVHVLELVGGEDQASAPVVGGLPVLDETAIASYRRRLAEVEDDLDEADRHHDLGRLERAEADRDYLVAELARAVGLGGRRRETGGSAERARTSVARALRYALGRLAEAHPTLAAHLEQHVRTGTYCCYEPDAVAPVTWET